MMLVILFGAIVHATMQLQVARKNKEPFTFVDFLILLVIASFAGWLFGTVSSIYFADPRIVHVATGVGAVMGVAGINTVAEVFLESIKDFLKARLK